MKHWHLVAMGRSIIAVTLFVSNIFFWRTTGYFAGAAEQAPMLHTWSLAVEEQFYLLFPLVLIVLRGLEVRWLTLILVAGALASLALADWGSTRYISATFYLAPTRAWELLAGSLAAIWLMQRGPLRGWQGELAGLGGLIAICIAITVFDESTPFPGRWALVPVMGTVCVVLGAGQSTLAGRMLSWRVLVGIGLISYSAYLWHQPLLAFGRILFVDPSPLLLAMLGASALPLAWASWL